MQPKTGTHSYAHTNVRVPVNKCIIALAIIK